MVCVSSGENLVLQGHLSSFLIEILDSVGRDGLTHNMLELIHTHWRRQPVCKVRCLGVPTVDMHNICRCLEVLTFSLCSSIFNGDHEFGFILVIILLLECHAYLVHLRFSALI